MTSLLSPDLRSRLERLTGHRVVEATRVSGGYTPALRLRLVLDDGTSRFAKIGTREDTARWLRAEHRIYSAVEGDFMARSHGWEDDGSAPILLLEDLSHAHWPPPWREGDVAAVARTLAQVAASTPPGGLPRLEQETELLASWSLVAAEPAPFLSLSLASSTWLDRVLPGLLAIEPVPLLAGSSLVHLDVRSDNLCLAGGRAILVDWNFAAVGNPRFDVAFWLPSLESEGGPPPETLLPDAGGLAAIVCGYLACRAGRPEVPHAPGVRALQRRQLERALPWMVRALDLPPLDRGS